MVVLRTRKIGKRYYRLWKSFTLTSLSIGIGFNWVMYNKRMVIWRLSIDIGPFSADLESTRK